MPGIISQGTQNKWCALARAHEEPCTPALPRMIHYAWLHELFIVGPTQGRAVARIGTMDEHRDGRSRLAAARR